MSAVMEKSPNRHRITVEEFYRMGEMGLFAPDARVELIEGEIIDMPPIGSVHAGIVLYLNETLSSVGKDRTILAVQSPILLGNYSVPLPDIALLRRSADFYVSALPKPADVLLAIEVSDSTLPYDKGVKAPLYARHEVPEYWIVDVNAKQIQAFQAPQDGTYSRSWLWTETDTACLGSVPDLKLNLSRLFELMS
jgi:Uma2 family endonuclease